jgi:hypothetical protein
MRFFLFFLLLYTFSFSLITACNNSNESIPYSTYEEQLTQQCLARNSIGMVDKADSILDEMDAQGFLEPQKPSLLFNIIQICGCYIMIRYLEFKKACRNVWRHLLIWIKIRETKK